MKLKSGLRRFLPSSWEQIGPVLQLLEPVSPKRHNFVWNEAQDGLSVSQTFHAINNYH